MSDQPTAPEGMAFERRTYRSLIEAIEQDDAVYLIRVQGIATKHEAFLLQSPDRGYDRIIYAIAPDSGPYDFIVNKFPNEERDFSMWSLPPWNGPFDREQIDGAHRKVTEVLHYVVDMAQYEVEQERA